MTISTWPPSPDQLPRPRLRRPSPAPPRAWLPPVPPPPVADQIARWASDLGGTGRHLWQCHRGRLVDLGAATFCPPTPARNMKDSTDTSKRFGHSIRFDPMTGRWHGCRWERINSMRVDSVVVTSYMTEAEARSWLARCRRSPL